MNARLFLPALAALLASGCVTMYDQESVRQEELAQRQREAALQERNERLRDGVENLQAEVQRLRTDLDRLRAEQGRAGSAQLQGLEESIADLNRRLAAEVSARERDRKAILDSVSSTLATALRSGGGSSRSSGGSSGGTTRRGSPSGEGYMHKVEAGQTLSAIATAYKTTTAAIMEANGIKNPGSLRVGQELVIPAP